MDSDFIEVVTAPDGSTFVVLVAPPGSALDADSPRFLAAIGNALRGVLGRRWRVVVQEQLPDGSLRPVERRRRFATRDEAERRAADLVRRISGSGIRRRF